MKIIFNLGNIECIDTLIKYGCDVNLRDADGRPTLYILALENNVGVAKYLLEHSNINVNLPDNEGRTPLHVSAWQGHLEMVELLVAQGKFYFWKIFFFSLIYKLFINEET